jgi:GT2 family glycosyltransferase
VKIDYALIREGLCVCAGWTSEGLEVESGQRLAYAHFARPDAERAINAPARGFIGVYRASRSDALDIRLTGANPNETAQIELSGDGAALAALMTDHGPRMLAFFAQLAEARAWVRPLIAFVEQAPANASTQSGCLDLAARFGEHGAVVWGWARTSADATLGLINDAGDWLPMANALRFERIDLAEKAGVDNVAATTGYVMRLSTEQSLGAGIYLVAVDKKGVHRLHQMNWTEALDAPLDYARRCFDQPSATYQFMERLARQDGELLARATESHAARPRAEPMIWDYGLAPARPEISVIIPLYGRIDYVEQQLLEFRGDLDFTSGRVELIYVLDDPRVVDAMRAQSALYEKLYGLPYRVVWSGANLGYAAANNLGARLARGDTLILLNSDVFPMEPGWAGRMADTLARRPACKALGARMTYADGSVQHAGMRFEYSREYDVWLNQHPGRCLEPLDDVPDYLEVEATTGACMAVRRTDYMAVGGLDEGYLLGDFEDSDLCLKLRAAGAEIGVLNTIRLTHLERQSMPLTGAAAFRFRVVLFNAWRHKQRWGAAIERLVASREPS